MVGLNSQNSWLLGFASPSFHLSKGNTVPVDVTFDGQSEARLFATANSDIMATAILPPNVARTFQKSSLMVVTTGNSSALQFNLTSTAPLLATIANCVNTVKAGGINSAGEFSAPNAVAATKPDGSSNPKSGRTGTQTGTGYVISANGHISPIITSSTAAPAISRAISRERPQPRCAWSTAIRLMISRCCKGRRILSRLLPRYATARFIPVIR